MAGATLFTHDLLLTMHAGAGATLFTHALLLTMHAGAGATLFYSPPTPIWTTVVGSFFASILARYSGGSTLF